MRLRLRARKLCAFFLSRLAYPAVPPPAKDIPPPPPPLAENTAALVPLVSLPPSLPPRERGAHAATSKPAQPEPEDALLGRRLSMLFHVKFGSRQTQKLCVVFEQQARQGTHNARARAASTAQWRPGG